MLTEAPEFEERIDAMRRFNRFYTRRIGVLRDGYLRSPFSLAQVRVLYELAHRERSTAAELARDLELDAGYLSRILAGFDRRGLLDKQRSSCDGRESLLGLSPAGRAAFGPLEASARDEIGGLLAPLSEREQRQLVTALSHIETLLGHGGSDAPTYLLREPRPGDMGWVVERHGALYAQEYGWDEGFEALVAGIVASFIEHQDPRRERCWIAERHGERIGCVFLVRASKTLAKLRLFLVEPEARGHGIGGRLVDECIAFARSAGYRTLRLWTQSNLLAARRIYTRVGFQKIAEEAHHSFSKDLVAETWELRL